MKITSLLQQVSGRCQTSSGCNCWGVLSM